MSRNLKSNFWLALLFPLLAFRLHADPTTNLIFPVVPPEALVKIGGYNYTSLEERLVFVKTNAFLQKVDAKIEEAIGKEPKLKASILSEAHSMARIQQAKINDILKTRSSRELEMELEEITSKLSIIQFALGFKHSFGTR
jgi:tRNA/tmRNA/rRNA uracil-C5-methylase (TrmA/RlmC/RlmD family)